MTTDALKRIQKKAPALPVPVEQSPETDCSRWAKRRPSHALVNIQSSDAGKPISCTMRNSSSTGALLECAGGDQGEAFSRLPDQFVLFLPMERVAIDCRLVWRHFRQIGVQYTSPARVIAKPVPRIRTNTEQKKSLLARAAAKVKG